VPLTIDRRGSYFLEHLTDQMEEHAMAYIRKIDAMAASSAPSTPATRSTRSRTGLPLSAHGRPGPEVVVGVNKYVMATRSRSNT